MDEHEKGRPLAKGGPPNSNSTGSTPQPQDTSEGAARVRPPTLVAKRTRDGGLKVRCDHCRDWHYHGWPPGSRVAHCWRDGSPYRRFGYILVLAEDGAK